MMDNKQSERGGKPFDPIAELAVPDLANMSREERNVSYLYVIYALYALGMFGFGIVPTLGGVIMAYAKRNELRGTIYFDHIQFLLKTFWITVIGSAIGYVLLFVLVGFLILPLVGAWYVFRVIAGFLRLRDNRSVTPTGWLM